jgi:hypothetical protein
MEQVVEGARFGEYQCRFPLHGVKMEAAEGDAQNGEYQYQYPHFDGLMLAVEEDGARFRLVEL